MIDFPALSIDTSTATTFVALALNQGEIIERATAPGQSHSEELSALVDGLLREGGVTPSRLKAVCYGAGPGSFTGLRISLAFIKGLAFSTDLAVIKLSSLRVFAEEFLCVSDSVAAIGDARRGELFAALYSGALSSERKAGDEILPPSIIQKDKFLQLVQASSLATTWVGAFEPEVESELGLGVEITRPGSVGRSLFTLAQRGEGTRFIGKGKLAELVPEYMREVSAKTIEERRKISI